LGKFSKVIFGRHDGSSSGFFGKNEKGRRLSDLVSVSKSTPFLLMIFLCLLLKKSASFLNFKKGANPDTNTVGSSPTSCSEQGLGIYCFTGGFRGARIHGNG
jgi:hypothetical protein